ncbi:hypothetical protein CGCSCA5_v007065 [Colletotrichum siamense]|nr:hypothetical protein CGCSCA5_v007065 [Colletotrichum siamense]
MAQSPQLTAGGQLPQYAPQQNGSRPGSAASHTQNRAGASSNSPPIFPYAPQQQPSAPTPSPPAPKQTPVPVPVPGQPAVNGTPAAAGEPPKISSDVPKPAQGSASPALSNGQTPSSEEIAKSQKFSEDYTKLCTLIAECDEDAVRRAVRDNFEKCLLGSHYHMAFIMNVAMHRADGGILKRAIRDFGQRIVSEGKADLVGWLKPADLDELADNILSKASDQFLDKALVTRLPKIEARRLVNALARANRLGYDANDIVENEHVIPTAPAQSSMQRPPAPGPPPPPPPAAAAARPVGFHQPMTPASIQAEAPTPHRLNPMNVVVPKAPQNMDRPECTFCHRIFGNVESWTHHVKKRLCLRPLVALGNSDHLLLCPHCGQSFNGHAGLQYHMMNKVCGDFGPVSKEMVQNVKTIPGAAASSYSAPGAPGMVSKKRPRVEYYTASQSQSPAPSQVPQVQVQTPQHQSMSQVPTSTPQSSFPNNHQPAPLGTPRAKDMAHLTGPQIEALLSELRRAEEDFKFKIADAKKLGLTEEDTTKKLTSLRNSFACKQSTIRKKYGIKLRERRGRAEMEAERDMMGYGSTPRMGTPASSDKHADKRARVNGAGDASVTQSQEPPSQSTPIKQVAVADIGGGLTGSNATAATEDPTMASQPPRSSQPTSSFQQGGYRVQTYEPAKKTSPTKVPGGSMTAQELLRQMNGPIEIDSSSSSSESESSDSDSDTGTEEDGDGPGLKAEQR